MPVSDRFEGRIFWLTNAGDSTVDELAETFEAALDDPDFPERAVLPWDIRDSSSLKERSAEEPQSTTRILGPKVHSSPVPTRPGGEQCLVERQPRCPSTRSFQRL